MDLFTTIAKIIAYCTLILRGCSKHAPTANLSFRTAVANMLLSDTRDLFGIGELPENTLIQERFISEIDPSLPIQQVSESSAGWQGSGGLDLFTTITKITAYWTIILRSCSKHAPIANLSFYCCRKHAPIANLSFYCCREHAPIANLSFYCCSK